MCECGDGIGVQREAAHVYGCDGCADVALRHVWAVLFHTVYDLNAQDNVIYYAAVTVISTVLLAQAYGSATQRNIKK